MGVQARVVLYASDEPTAQRGFERAFGEMARLEALLSDYRPDSELSRINQAAGSGEWVEISPDTERVLRRGSEVAKETQGAFDLTVGPVVSLWRETRQTGVLPEPSPLREALSKVNWRDLELRERGARLRQPGMKLDAGGIAKGDAVHAAVRVLRQMRIQSSLVSLAGDIAAGDPPPGESGWIIEVKPAGDATSAIEVKNACVSTSGDVEQFVEIGGVRYSHIVDPRTGVGVTHRLAATVIAEEGSVADAMATALSVMPFEQAKAFASDRGGISVMLYQAGDGGAQFWQLDREKRIKAVRRSTSDKSSN
jgi:thiamine biosynthesis lipoprotein